MTSSVDTPSAGSSRWVRWTVGFVAIAVSGVIVMENIVRTSTLPESIHEPVVPSPVIYDREGDVVAQLPQGRARTHVVGSLATMGRFLPEVTVALEDHRFYEHTGIDLYAIGGAAWSDIKARRLHRGASTITQQLIKQELGKRGRQWGRKWREAVLALKLERYWSKDAILEGYLNRLDYGNRRLGAESAAMAYFGKRCAALTLGEAIYLAGLPQAPSRYNPWRNPESAARKYGRAVDRLAKVGYLDSEQAAQLKASPPIPEKVSMPNRAPFFVEALKTSHGRGNLRGGLVSSLDAAVQAAAERLLQTHLEDLGRPDVANGAVVVIENAGAHVRALAVGHRKGAEETSAWNAALTPRHAGSTLKPLVYQQALESRRFTAASVLPDTADAVRAIYPDYDPKNYNRRYHGPVRLRDALGNSLNIPAILVSHEVGARRAYDRLTAWGLRLHDSFAEDGAGFALGNRRVTLLDLSLAYSSLARGGRVAQRPSFLESEQVPMAQLAAPVPTRILSDILSDDRARSRAFGTASILRFPGRQRTAVKTGTSSNYRDAWIVGYNHSFTVGVWMGNLEGRRMAGTPTVEIAGPIWRGLVDWLTVHRGARALESLDPQTGLVAVTIDALTGLRPVAATRRTLNEWFLQGSEPKEAGDGWYRSDGGIQLPPEYDGWCRSPHNDLQAVVSPEAGRPEAAAPWRITSPREGARFVIDPALPRAQQVLPFLTDHPAPERLRWYLNDRHLTAKEASALRWTLEPGHWVLRAHEPATGREVRHRFVVE